MQCRCKKNLFYIVIPTLLLAITTACTVSKNQFPPVGYWYSEDPHFSFDIDEEEKFISHGTYEIDGEIREAAVVANDFAGTLEIFDARAYDIDKGERIHFSDFPYAIYKGTYKLKGGKLHFKLFVRNDGIEKMETVIMENIAAGED